jgi:DNA-binding MarR family transcriptional regulator
VEKYIATRFLRRWKCGVTAPFCVKDDSNFSEGAMWTELDQNEGSLSRSFIAHRIERAYMRLADQTAKVLKESCGLTLRQWWAICDMMADNPGTLRELSLIPDTDPDLVNRNLMILADFGYVWRDPDEQDHRRVKIGLTAAGEALYGRVIQVMRQRNAHLTRNMSDSEVNNFMMMIGDLERSAMDDLSVMAGDVKKENAFGQHAGVGAFTS